MTFTAKDVADLRAKTGAGMMDCKKALTESDGNTEAAEKWLREKGILSAQKKSARIASEGIVDSYIHAGGRMGVLVEVNCETDFVARGDKFRELVHDIALQIGAMKPLYVSSADVPADIIEGEKNILRAQIANDPKLAKKPPQIIDTMIDGRVKKYYEDFCLLDQTFVKDPSKTIGQLVTEAVAQIGEKISVRRFVCFEMGEGLEKKSENLAEEVEKQAAAAAAKSGK
ncbi:MAG: translation elongation factor Ts [Clostridiales bacterium]|jgi:elongation factor Ts|nr:translation elongation factor Ts [Clostridiales bacterium]